MDMNDTRKSDWLLHKDAFLADFKNALKTKYKIKFINSEKVLGFKKQDTDIFCTFEFNYIGELVNFNKDKDVIVFNWDRLHRSVLSVLKQNISSEASKFYIHQYFNIQEDKTFEDFEAFKEHVEENLYLLVLHQVKQNKKKVRNNLKKFFNDSKELLFQLTAKREEFVGVINLPIKVSMVLDSAKNTNTSLLFNSIDADLDFDYLLPSLFEGEVPNDQIDELNKVQAFTLVSGIVRDLFVSISSNNLSQNKISANPEVVNAFKEINTKINDLFNNSVTANSDYLENAGNFIINQFNFKPMEDLSDVKPSMYIDSNLLDKTDSDSEEMILFKQFYEELRNTMKDLTTNE